MAQNSMSQELIQKGSILSPSDHVMARPPYSSQNIDDRVIIDENKTILEQPDNAIFQDRAGPDDATFQAKPNFEMDMKYYKTR